MRRTAPVLVLSLAFGVASSTVAFATDLHTPIYKAAPYKAPILAPLPVYSWTGFYAGGHGGYGWSELSGTDPTGGSSAELKGWLAGLQLGYNYQIGKFVIGIEGDYSWSGVEYTESNPFGTGGEASITNDYFATVAARLGYALDRWLVYGKGGVAWTREKWDVTDGVGGFANGSFDRTGWMLGAGVEYAFWNGLSAKVEYNYLNFGSIDELLTAGGGLAAAPASVSLNSHLLKFGLNYRFF